MSKTVSFTRNAVLAAGVTALLAAPAMTQDSPGSAGLTGDTHPADIVEARQQLKFQASQLLIGLEELVEGEALNQGVDYEIRSLALTIGAILNAFPHLMAPQTSPDRIAESGVNVSTQAMLSVWEEFDTFYALATGTASLAITASEAEDVGAFGEAIGNLRAQCTACHDQYLEWQMEIVPDAGDFDFDDLF